jgi:hypothetical protein
MRLESIYQSLVSPICYIVVKDQLNQRYQEYASFQNPTGYKWKGRTVLEKETTGGTFRLYMTDGSTWKHVDLS